MISIYLLTIQQSTFLQLKEGRLHAPFSMDINLYLHNVDSNPEEASRIATSAAKRMFSWISDDMTLVNLLE